MAVIAALMANQGYTDDSNNQSSGVGVGDVAALGAWFGAEHYQAIAKRATGTLSARLGLSPRTGPSVPWISKNAKTKKWEADRVLTGRLKTWGEFSRDVEKTAESKFSTEARRAVYRSKATRLFGAARTEALLTTGLRIANAAMLVPMLFGMTYHGFKGIQRLGFELERPGFGWGRNTLSSMAFTDRQRSIQAMHNSEFNGRSSMGQEAFLLHQ